MGTPGLAQGFINLAEVLLVQQHLAVQIGLKYNHIDRQQFDNLTTEYPIDTDEELEKQVGEVYLDLAHRTPWEVEGVTKEDFIAKTLEHCKDERVAMEELQKTHFFVEKLKELGELSEDEEIGLMNLGNAILDSMEAYFALMEDDSIANLLKKGMQSMEAFAKENHEMLANPNLDNFQTEEGE